MFIRWIAKTFVAINSNTKPSQIAAAVSFAFLLALIPKANLLWISLFVLTFFLKINLAIEFVFIAIFDLITLLLDGILDKIGYVVLTLSSTEGFFTVLFNNTFFYFSRYYNTIVMGGLIVGIICFAPIYFLSNAFISLYREKVREKIAHNKFINALSKQPLIAGLKRKFVKALDFYNSIK